MMVQPTDDMVKKVSKGRIDTLIESCPELTARVATKKSRSGENTIEQKNFTGGTLYMAGANSAVGLRSVPIRYLILDETDAYPEDLDGEGSPIDLAIARTRTFANKKVFIISTPTITGMSAIEREYNETDQNYYHVPCPHCGEKQRLIFENLKWEEGEPQTARYVCVHCGAFIEERYKTQMLTNGEWIPNAPERTSLDVIGFHLNSLYSPYGWQSWRDIATEFVKCKENPNRLKTFVNTTLGETWKEKGEAPPFKNLYNRRENYSINTLLPEVCFITSGVDVQKDRLELEIVGWCADKRSYSIDYRVLEGDTAAPAVWEALAAVLQERFVRDNGVELPIRIMAVDTGYNTSHVHSFCRKYGASRAIPIKGQDNMQAAFSPPQTVDVTQSGKRIGRLRQWNIGVSFLKAELYSWLQLEKDADGVPPPCYCHFPQYDEHYFRGLTAEEHVKKIVKGYSRYYWQKIYDRNEPLDCRIYARAAASIIGIDRFPAAKLAQMCGVTIAPATD
jgi:phage terminase large subunit GpA-like protein